MNVKKQQLELDMEQQTGSELGKEYVKGVHCHPAYLTYMQSTSCDTLRAKSEELKDLLMKVKEECEKAGLKFSIQKWRSWHPVPSLHGKQMGKEWQNLFSWGPKLLQMVTVAMKLKEAWSLEEKLWPT